MKEIQKNPSSKCEYLIGDDTCRAVRGDDLSGQRDDKCENPIKDACCYACHTRSDCEISCDLLDKTVDEEEQKPEPQKRGLAPNSDLQDECSNCLHYMKSKCPRNYEHDAELWRKQDVCRIFRPATKSLPKE